jgi:hypothetical protein
MLFLTRCFGVTGSDAERDPGDEQSVIDEITEKVLLLQAKSAAQQNRPLGRGTHSKGICVRAEFEVLDVTAGPDPALGSRLAKGIFAKPGVYPAVVRFGNADPKVNSDFKPDVRSLSFSVDLTRGGTLPPTAGVSRQDFSLQNAPPLPINDSRAFLAVMKVLTASNPAVGLWSMPLKDKLRALRAIALAQMQSRQTIKPYQQLRYWSNVPFRHGATDTVEFSAIPTTTNAARPLDQSNPRALQDEMSRHLKEDGKMSSFDFGVQFLAPATMTYWGKHYDQDFWIENASVVWKESEAPFHIVGRLTLSANSQLSEADSRATYFDVTGHSTLDSRPVGSINRARWRAEAASKEARLRVSEVIPSNGVPVPPISQRTSAEKTG